MAGEWSTARLAQVAAINPDAVGRDWPHTYMNYLDISSVGMGQMDAPPQRLSIAEAPSRAKRLIRKGDTVISTVRPNRRSMFFASNPGEDWVVSTGFAVLRPNATQIDPRYLYACVFNQAFTEYLIGREKGAAYPAVSPEDIGNAEIALPPLDDQRAIAHVLGTLDDKIELNRRMNETLEAIARAMFKSWFVDFDPVRAKMSGEPPESICQRLGLTPDLLALFPDRLVDSELGEIPEGWDVMPLERLSEKISKGTTPTKQDITSATDEPSISFIKVKDIDEIGEVILSGLELIPATVHQGALKRSILETGDILFSIAGTIGRVAVVEADLAGSNTNQAVAFIRLKDRASHFGLCLQHLVSERIKEAASASVVQGVQANVSLASLGAFKILVPDAGVLELWNKIFDGIYRKKKICAAESHSLVAIRDAILPKLLSGELRVPVTGAA